MTNAGKIAAGIGGIIVVGAIAASLGGVFNNGGNGDGGIDVSGTPCDSIGAARGQVQAELEQRQTDAESQYGKDLEAASDSYWEKYRQLEDARNACETNALLADPCKDLFEESSRLAQEILAGIDDGFDETKAQKREEAKKEYDDCLKNPPEQDTYEGKHAKCESDFTTGQVATQTAREQTETTVATKREQANTKAQNDYQSKMATLAEIERKCNIPPPTTNVNTGGITTGGTGTVIQSGSPACSGRFSGYDPDTQAEISRLTQLYNQAMAGGKYEGLGGANTLSAKINELRTEMVAGPRQCTNDAFCGDPEPVCCSQVQIGQVKCTGGVCVAEKTDCQDDEICTGKPAECVAPAIGIESPEIAINKQYVIGQTCSNNLQSLNLQQATPTSDRYEITGSIPNWLGFSHVGGKLPQDVLVTAQCSTLLGQGPGTYTAKAKITVYDQDNNLINTIPLAVTIQVIAPADDQEPKVKVGEDIDLVDPDDQGQEEAISVGPGQISFTYDHAKPVCPLSITPVIISGPPGSEWYIDTPLPVWLDAPNGTSGTVPATVPLQFPCRLDEYKNQQQLSKIPFIVTPPDGNEVTVIIKVSASIINFEE